VNRPFQSAFEADAYPELVGKAAALFHSLVANHCFIDGNKRTAVLTLQNFIVLNGYFLTLSNDNMYELAQETASHRARGVSASQAYDKILAVLKQHTISFSRVRTMAIEKPAIHELYEALIGLRRSAKVVLNSLHELRKLGVDTLGVDLSEEESVHHK
jgi:death on curing protein